MECTRPTVFVVDDDRSCCRAVERLLLTAGYRVETYSKPAEFMSRWRPERPGCLVLDMRMPELPGLEVQRLVGTSTFPIPIIFISGHADAESCVRAMRDGAADFLLKPFEDEELLNAVERGIAQDRDARRQREEAEELRASLARLTRRETEVFRLVVKGMLNKQIAAVLATKEGTVKMHRGHLMRKLQLGSVAELVLLAHRLHLSEPSPSLHARAGRFRPVPEPAGA